MPMALSLPPDLIAEYDRDAGDSYGARSALFRKMYVYWKGRVDNPAERDYQRERTRRIIAEAKLRELQVAWQKVMK